MGLKRKPTGIIILMIFILGMIGTTPIYGYESWDTNTNGSCDNGENCGGGGGDSGPLDFTPLGRHC
jgi:hypothetical protein